MKLNKKKVLVTALALSIIAILSVGTLAWFSDEDKVTNKFYIADSNDTDPDDIFSVDVWEKGQVGDGIKYEDILPGDVLEKLVYVKNTGHYEQYIRVLVTLTDAREWGAIFGVDVTKGEQLPLEKLVKEFKSSMWTNQNMIYNSEQNTLTYVLYYDGVLHSNETIQVFESVKIPETLTQEQASSFGGGFEIDVKAQAVQVQNTGANAYAAFGKVGMGL